MSSVFRAFDEKLGRDVAVKVVERGGASQREALFRDEIRIVSTLGHPNILALHDSGEAEGFLYFVMPFVESSTLDAHIAARGALSLAETAEIVMEVARGLEHAHRHQVLHRDVKPDNILLRDGRAVVSDFGIALLRQVEPAEVGEVEPSEETVTRLLGACEGCLLLLLIMQKTFSHLGKASVYEWIACCTCGDMCPLDYITVKLGKIYSSFLFLLFFFLPPLSLSSIPLAHF